MEAKALLRAAVPLSILLASARIAFGAILFQDGFESGALSPAWTITSTEQGRATVTTNFAPASGQWQLVLDDSVDDAVYSVSEATFELDLLNKKNVMLTFKAKSLGNEPDYPSWMDNGNRRFDGVSISVDGGANWQTFQTLATVGTEWESFSIPLYPVLQGAGLGLFSRDCRIRFSEYDNASAPLDGIAIDDVTVTGDDDQRAIIEIPHTVMEGTGPYTGYVFLAIPATNDMALTLRSSLQEVVLSPQPVVVPAGSSAGSFSFSVNDDNLANLTRTGNLTATAENVTSVPSYLTILDDEMPKVTVNLPQLLAEGDNEVSNASVVLDRAPVVPFGITLNSDPYDELQYFSVQVEIPPGETQAVFTVNATDDAKIDGNVLVAVTATESDSGLPLATNYLTTVDNESSNLTLILPATIQEGTTASGTVKLSGTLTSNLDVNLTSSNTSALSIPSSVTIPAYSRDASFTILAVDNSIRDGTRNVAIGAAATGFAGTQTNLSIRDNDVAGYAFGELSNIVNVSDPVPITVSATDIEGHAISNFVGTVNLSVVLPDGTSLPLTPSTVQLSSTGWAGSVTFPAVNSGLLRLRASDGGSNSGESPPFDIMRIIPQQAADIVWDSTRQKLYASVPQNAAGTNANRILVIDADQAKIIGSVATPLDPGQLVLTSGGEYLYAALNNVGSIARINLTNMTVESVFSLGTDSNYGTLFPADICAVSGQPDLLVVSRAAMNDNFSLGVAVYDRGVPRPLTTAEGTDQRIEPSADPDTFFGIESYYDHALRQFRLDPLGVTNTDAVLDLPGTYPLSGVRADGDEVFFPSGGVVDGKNLQILGQFAVNGPVLPDLAKGRVYYLERSTPWNGDGYDEIGSYDPKTFTCIRKESLSSAIQPWSNVPPVRFIRWGTNGLAVLSRSNIVLISSSQLVPNGAPANLAVAVRSEVKPVSWGMPVTYDISITNNGTGVANHAVLQVTLSRGQTVQSVFTTNGIASLSSNTITLRAGDLAANAIATMTVTTSPQFSGLFTCAGDVEADSPDPDFNDNRATNQVSVGYSPALDSISALVLKANNLVYDPTRNLLWAAILPSDDPPLSASIASIDPTTGIISTPIPIGENPLTDSMAISGNGRYLYLGLENSPEVYRLDLDSGTSLRIAIGVSQGFPAKQIVPLGGDGTSFLVSDGAKTSVFDGTVQRPDQVTGSLDQIVPSFDSNVFLGYDNSYPYDLNSLTVTSSGVQVTQSAQQIINGTIAGNGDWVLSSSGYLANSSNLTLVANLQASGTPCIDLPNHRAYLLAGSGNTAVLRAFDNRTFLPSGGFEFPPYEPNSDFDYGYQPEKLLKWGLDGFAVLDYTGAIYVFRWSGAIPNDVDSDANGFSDAWEASYFNSLNTNPASDPDSDGMPNFEEYLFGTSPVDISQNPLRAWANRDENVTVLHLVFPRRAGLPPGSYEYVVSSDLKQWRAASNVVENVLSTQTAGSAQTETVEAILSNTNSDAQFVRFKWR